MRFTVTTLFVAARLTAVGETTAGTVPVSRATSADPVLPTASAAKAPNTKVTMRRRRIADPVSVQEHRLSPASRQW